MNAPNLLAITCGHVNAPAGFGKSQLIADCLIDHLPDKPVLILTHTNAGVAALRSRLVDANVSSKAYSLMTLDGWALRLLYSYPMRAGIDPSILEIRKPKQDYPAIKQHARVLLESRAIDLILKSSYSRVIVDEYQDCSRDQHAWVTAIARLMPAVVLGDPLQTVFDFDGHRLNWQDDVCSAFPEAYALTTPWRWKRAGAPQLGVWVTQLRQKLEANESIQLTDLPDGVTHVIPKTPALRREQQQKEVRRLARIGRVLVIGSSHAEYQRFEFARLTHGVTVVETVELREMMALSQKLNLAKPDQVLAKLVDFAHLVMTGVLVKPFHKRIATLRAGRGTKGPSASEDAALQLLRDPTHERAVRLLRAFHNTSRNRLFRPTLFFAALSALERVADGRDVTLEQAARAERDVRRQQERSAGQVAIGSTLLLKGLEADVCMILDADSLKKCHLYVALTRGTRAVSIWSRTTALQPH